MGIAFRRLSISALAAVSVLAALPAKAETLADALVSAYENSGLLEQNRATLRAADEGVAQAVARLRPVVSYTIASQRNYSNGDISGRFTETAHIDFSLPIYQFGRGNLAVEVQKETVLATRDALTGVEQQVLLRAVSAYMNVRRDLQSVDLSNNQVRLISEELRAARDRFDVGEITRTDVSQAEASLALARANLAAREGSLAVSREEYRAVVGRYPSSLARAPRAPSAAADMRAAVNIARQNHPDLKGAQRQVTISELSLMSTERQMLPSVNLTARTGVVENDRDLTGNIGVSVTGPIYQGGQLKSLQRQSMAQRDASRANLLLTGQRIEQNVANAWSQLRVSQAQITASNRAITASRAAWEGVREEARLGARTTLDVLDAEQNLLDARTNLASAQADAQIAAYTLLSSMGLLTAEHLNLGVQTYDPADYYNAVSGAPLGAATSEQGERLDNLLRSIAGGGNN
ncbi:TolC family outer membrane protein [Thalassobius sp. I31.1]|uniref:TolC family outer membrane protein n=1 Tax=Thalassobius sp. I31.1 TaxID=2109912 RepID=UPI000D1C1421|nr:TolC family outer membrane protein [Thalassobius sp. I31.1]